MPSDWMPGVQQIRSSHNGGSMTGGPPRFVWHSYEADPNKVSASSGAHSLINAGNEVHFCFNPITGDLIQILPASVAGRGLVNLSGGTETNREGNTCFQMEVIAFAKDPFTDYITPAGLDTIAALMDYVRSFGIPDVWPSGSPPVYPPGSGNRSVSNWQNKAGHFSHSQVPENSHGDPGAIDVNLIFGAGMAFTDNPDAVVNWTHKIPDRHGTTADPGSSDQSASLPAQQEVYEIHRWTFWALNILKDGPDANSALHAAATSILAATTSGFSGTNTKLDAILDAVGNISVTLSDQDKQDIISGVVAAMDADLKLTVKDAVTEVLREGITAQPVG